MKPITWNDGSVWGDPNLRWGSPSYRLEPGDEGYVPPAPVPSEPPTQKKRMKHNKYFPVRQSDQIPWLSNLANKLGDVAAALGLTTAQVNAAVADCLWLIYILQNWVPAARTWGEAVTAAAAEAQTGTGTAPQELPDFTAPTLPTATSPVAPGALTRIFKLVSDIQDGGKCTDAIALNLGIQGSEATGPDPATLRPVLALLLVSGEVLIKWGWGGYRAWLKSCEIWVDRGDGKGFVFLTIDTTPNYTDTMALPAQNTEWKYKAIYRDGEAQFGLWSEVVSLAVQKA